MSEPKVETNENLKPGIIYFSRLPPFMKPAKVRYIFAQYGEVGRLFLQAEGIEKIVHVFDKGVGLIVRIIELYLQRQQVIFIKCVL